MTKKQIESVKGLRIGTSTEVGRVTIKRDRGQYNISKGTVIETYKDSELALLIERVDELNTEPLAMESKPFVIEGADGWIGYKTTSGYDIYENGKLIHQGLNERAFEIHVNHRRKEKEERKRKQVKKEISKDFKVAGRKKALYYTILVLSSILFVMVFVLGVKFDGINFKRDNNDLYNTITYISNRKYPGKKSDKYDAVYYTLNYHAQKKNYLMTPTEDSDMIVTTSLIYYKNAELEERIDYSLSREYTGTNFNMLFKNIDGKFVNARTTYLYIGYIMDVDLSMYTDNKIMLDELAKSYVVWDKNNIKVDTAYMWESELFDRNTEYFSTYLKRNKVIKMFLNDSSKFVHEYVLFESLGWLNWTSIAFFVIYILLVIGVWIFRKDHIKNSKFLITTIIILSSLIIIPLAMQYLFEGLSKDASEFLDILENTRFTTTTTLMNFIFDYIMKFSNIVLTGIITITLPVKVIRYFVHAKISKINPERTITKSIGPGEIVTEKITSSSWRG